MDTHNGYFQRKVTLLALMALGGLFLAYFLLALAQQIGWVGVGLRLASRPEVSDQLVWLTGCLLGLLGALAWAYWFGHPRLVLGLCLGISLLFQLAIVVPAPGAPLPQALWIPILMTLAVAGLRWALVVFGCNAVLLVVLYARAGVALSAANGVAAAAILVLLVAAHVVARRALVAERQQRQSAEAAQAALDLLNRSLELQVAERTQALSRAAQDLQQAAPARVLADAIEHLESGLVLYDAEDRLVACNQKFKNLYAVVADVLVPGTPYEQVLRTYHRRNPHLQARQDEDSYVANRLSVHNHQPLHDHEFERDGQWYLACDRRIDTGGFVGLRINITERKQAQAQALRLTHFDPLTGLANRTSFTNALSQQLRGQARGRLAVVLADLARFKTVNDTLGRALGDALLVQVAERLRQHLPGTLGLARLGADQFALLLPDAGDNDQITQVLHNGLQAVFGPPFEAGLTELRMTGRLGVAVWPDDAANTDTLLGHAEAALAQAKTGTETLVFYRPEMSQVVAGRLALENALRLALEQEQFVLHYQPKIDAVDGRLTGVEALIRWQHPTRGLVPPGEFIPVLEDLGLILDVGLWALRQAVHDHRRWLDLGLAAPRIAVNVSAVQLCQADFIPKMRTVLAEGASPVGLDIEITESLLMADVQASRSRLQALRDLGVEVAIDDFGTGYSSLAYLAKLPVQVLKMDRAFIATMLEDADHLTLVRSMVTLAHSLRLKVVAEGVETQAQAQMLRSLQCDQLQGYLFSRPVPWAELTTRLQHHTDTLALAA